MKGTFLLICLVFIGCTNKFTADEKCRYSYNEHLKLDSLKINPVISNSDNDEKIVDERKNGAFGGIYAFANSGDYYLYRFYTDSSGYTYEENNRDSLMIPRSPVVYYRMGVDDSNTTYISVFYFILNRQIDNLFIVNDNAKIKKLHHKRTDGFSNISISTIYFPRYTPEEVKSFKIYIEGDVLLCNGKKTHFKEPLIWNKEEAEKYAKQQNKLR